MTGAIWHPIATAPQDTLGVVVYARMICCGGEGRVVMVAARQGGKWWYPNGHEFEFTHWTALPDLPNESPGTLQ